VYSARPMSTDSQSLSSSTGASSASRAREQAPGFVAETWVVFRHELRNLLLSVRTLVSAGIYSGFAALVLFGFRKAHEAALAQAASSTGLDASAVSEQLLKRKEEVAASILKGFHWGSEGDAAEIVRDHVPLTIIFFFMLASMFLPFLVALVSFDQFSELSTRGARFALLRVRRETYVAGKALAAIAGVTGFLLVMWLVVALDTGFRGTDPGDFPIALKEGARAWMLMSAEALPYLALTALISSFVRPVLAFVGTAATWIGLFLGYLLADFAVPRLAGHLGEGAEEASRKLTLLFPWEHTLKLTSRDMSTVLAGAGSLFLLAVIGYAFTLFVVRRRDV
jgi:hypothetical protein